MPCAHQTERHVGSHASESDQTELHSSPPFRDRLQITESDAAAGTGLRIAIDEMHKRDAPRADTGAAGVRRLTVEARICSSPSFRVRSSLWNESDVPRHLSVL